MRFVGAGMVALSLLGPLLAAGCAGRRIEQGVTDDDGRQQHLCTNGGKQLLGLSVPFVGSGSLTLGVRQSGRDLVADEQPQAQSESKPEQKNGTHG